MNTCEHKNLVLIGSESCWPHCEFGDCRLCREFCIGVLRDRYEDEEEDNDYDDQCVRCLKHLSWKEIIGNISGSGADPDRWCTDVLCVDCADILMDVLYPTDIKEPEEMDVD